MLDQLWKLQSMTDWSWGFLGLWEAAHHGGLELLTSG